MQKLSDLPNIGKTLEDKLIRVGITTREDLINVGSEQALLRIRAIDNTACFNMLCALEGAIQGIRWHGLAPERKQELKSFLKLKNIPINPIKH